MSIPRRSSNHPHQELVEMDHHDVDIEHGHMLPLAAPNAAAAAASPTPTPTTDQQPTATVFVVHTPVDAVQSFMHHAASHGNLTAATAEAAANLATATTMTSTTTTTTTVAAATTPTSAARTSTGTTSKRAKLGAAESLEAKMASVPIGPATTPMATTTAFSVPLQFRAPEVPSKTASIANPGPLGLFSFAVTTMMLSFKNAFIVEETFVWFVLAFALAMGGFTQLLAGQWEMVKGNLFPATVFSVYGCFWLGLAIFYFFTSSSVIPTTHIPYGEALFFAIFGCLSLFFFVLTFRLNRVLQIILGTLVIAFACLIGGIWSKGSQKAGGAFGIICAAFAFYLGAAQMANEIFGRTVMPIGPYVPPPQQRKTA